MNTHEAWKGTIMGKEGECAAFVIDTVASPFLLSGITKPIADKADCRLSAQRRRRQCKFLNSYYQREGNTH